jgi:hypothetical protein
MVVEDSLISQVGLMPVLVVEPELLVAMVLIQLMVPVELVGQALHHL